MARPLLILNPHNATIEELKQVPRIDSNETATRCTAVQMLLAGADRALVCKALLVTNRALRKWTNRFNQCCVDGLLRMNTIGMVCPRTGQFFAIEASLSDSVTFQAFLDEADKTVTFLRTTNI